MNWRASLASRGPHSCASTDDSKLVVLRTVLGLSLGAVKLGLVRPNQVALLAKGRLLARKHKSRPSACLRPINQNRRPNYCSPRATKAPPPHSHGGQTRPATFFAISWPPTWNRKWGRPGAEVLCLVGGRELRGQRAGWAAQSATGGQAAVLSLRRPERPAD